jgi:GWxTD domain-containing protein
MRFVLILLLLTTKVMAQSVSSINFDYWYNLQGEVTMELHPVWQGDSITLFYQLKSGNPSYTSYTLKWEKKDSYNQRQGGVIIPHDSVKLVNGEAEGQFRFSKSEKPWLLLVKVTNNATGKLWYFYKQIEAHYPVNGFIEKGGKKQWLSYVSASGSYTVRGSGSGKAIHFSYYRDDFPTPSPPFADKELKMDRFLFPDSTFAVQPGESIGPFNKEGLYLAQEDTTSAAGFSFLVKRDPYPKYNRLGDLKGPLLFVTTREENDQIGSAGEDKAKFDRIILGITNDKERAKTFMRNYFKRVEIANYLFTSFKEGWKTDKGMVFIIFGAPDEVQVNGGQEIWGYKNPRQQFTFTKAGSVYHPDHYVLVRDKQYAEYWYQTIDLWRKSRL